MRRSRRKKRFRKSKRSCVSLFDNKVRRSLDKLLPGSENLSELGDMHTLRQLYVGVGILFALIGVIMTALSASAQHVGPPAQPTYAVSVQENNQTLVRSEPESGSVRPAILGSTSVLLYGVLCMAVSMTEFLSSRMEKELYVRTNLYKWIILWVSQNLSLSAVCLLTGTVLESQIFTATGLLTTFCISCIWLEVLNRPDPVDYYEQWTPKVPFRWFPLVGSILAYVGMFYSLSVNMFDSENPDSDPVSWRATAAFSIHFINNLMHVLVQVLLYNNKPKDFALSEGYHIASGAVTVLSIALVSMV